MKDRLDAGKLNLRDRSGYTALMFAIINGKEAEAIAITDKLDGAELRVARGEHSLMHLVYKEKQLKIGAAIAKKLNLSNSEKSIELMCTIFHGNESRALELVGQLSTEELQVKDMDGLMSASFATRKGMPTVYQAISAKIKPVDDPELV